MAGSRAELSVDLMAASTAGQRVSSRADLSAAVRVSQKAAVLAADLAWTSVADLVC